jgi:hypothetical protein
MLAPHQSSLTGFNGVVLSTLPDFPLRLPVAGLVIHTPVSLKMSTQDFNGIPFTLSLEQQNFRLMELPPDLLALITAPAPPKYRNAFVRFLSSH